MANITAVLMAHSVGVDPKIFRAALRRQNFSWHKHGNDWLVARNSPEHLEMIKVLRSIFERRSRT